MRNFYAGSSAGLTLTNFDDNVFVGYNAGTNNDVTSGNNVFIGSEAAYDNREIQTSVAIGHQSAYDFNLFGGAQSESVFIGYQTGYDYGGASSSVLIGYHAGKESKNTSTDNVYIGKLAGSKNQGNENVAIGTGSGYSISAANASQNVLIGFGTECGLLATFNTIIGHNANTAAGVTHGTILGEGSTIVSGLESTAVGSGASVDGNQSASFGHGTSTQGNGSISIGHNAEVVTSDEAISIGQNSMAQADQSIALGSNSVVSSLSGLAFGNGSNTVGDYAISFGDNSLAGGISSISIGRNSNTTANNAIAIGDNTAVGFQSSIALGSGVTIAEPNAMALGDNSSVSLGAVGSTAIGTNSNVCAPNTIVIGSGIAGSNEAVIIGDCAPIFSTTGDLEIVGGSLWVSGTNYTSDMRLKENIEKISSPLAIISELNGYTFDYKSDLSTGVTLPSTRTAGVMAQELNEAFPFPVKEGANGYFGVDYVQLIPLLLEGIKAQQEEIDELKNQFGQEESTASGVSSLTAKLSQNNPNPFSATTTIDYEIYGNFSNAELHVYNMSGELQVTKTMIESKGSVIIEGNFLEPGIYAYTLIVDGNSLETKTMVVSK